MCAQTGTVYYVSPRGNDANVGSRGKPWKTPDRARRAALRPGDQLLFQGGKTFSGTLRLEQKRGAPSRPVTIGSYGAGRATLHGGDGSALVAKGCRHLVIRDLAFAGSGRKGGNAASGLVLEGGANLAVDQVEAQGFRDSGVYVASVNGARLTRVHAYLNGFAGISSGSTDGRFSRDLYIGHCVAENNPGSPAVAKNHSGNGIVVGHVRRCTIEYCESFNNGWDMPWRGNGPVGIWAWNADRVVIQHCYAHDNKSPGHDGGGFDFDGGVTNSILQYNYSCNNIGAGYLLCQYAGAPTWQRNIVRYNISVNDGWKDHKAGIYIAPLSPEMSEAEIYHNTVYNAVGSAVAFLATSPAPGMRFRNNIFVSAEDIISGDPADAVFQGNCYWSLTGGPVATGGLSFADWLAVGHEKTGRSVAGCYADPRLAKPGATPAVEADAIPLLKAYRLLSKSPCLSAGVRLRNHGGRDLWRKPIPAGQPDIGAHQRS
jgi:hypothetical protein